MPTYSTKEVLVRRDDCLHIDTSTPSVEGESIATPSAPCQSEMNGSGAALQRRLSKVFYRIAQNRTGKIGIFARTKGKFSCKTQPDEIGRAVASAEGHHNSLTEVTATASSRTKIWSGEGQSLTRFPNKADKNIKKLSNATPNYSSDPLLNWELGLSAKANLRN